MHPEDIAAVSALVSDALEELAGDDSPRVIAATGRLRAAARILCRADALAAEEMRREMALCDAYRNFDEDLPF